VVIPQLTPFIVRQPFVYQLFQGSAKEYDLANAGESSSAKDYFYAQFYLGLFCEAAVNEPSKARLYMTNAVQSDYARGSGKGDYMTDVARVHCQVRGWT